MIYFTAELFVPLRVCVLTYPQRVMLFHRVASSSYISSR